MPAKRSASGQDDLTVRAKKTKTAAQDQGINDAGMKELFDANEINKVGNHSWGESYVEPNLGRFADDQWYMYSSQ